MLRCSPEAFAKCPTRKLCGNVHEATFTEDSECARFNRSVLDKPMSNADRIRAMSDEELAAFLCDRCEYCTIRRCPAAGMCEHGKGKANGLVTWLRQPAEGDA